MPLLRYIARRILFLLPLEIVVAVVRTLSLALLLPIVLLIGFFECLLRFLRTKNLKEALEPKGEHCPPPIPESVQRRADPCIYSQFYLRGQGLDVTWNNPDIWVAREDRPGVVLPDSYHLQADTNYIVTVQVHNAATVPVFGVRVRLRYRPWSFNSPDLVPIQADGAGNEVMRFVNVRGLADPLYQPETTTFRWHTPPVQAGQEKHFCIQAELSHPMDLNPDNNLGQENTSVAGSNPRTFAPGDEFEIEVPVFNRLRRVQRFTFEANAYVPDLEQEIDLTIQYAYGRAKRRLSERIAALVPVVRFLPPRSTNVPFKGLKLGPVGVGRPSEIVLVRSRYTGYDAIKKANAAGSAPLAAGAVRLVDADLEQGVDVDPRTARVARFRIRVPPDHPRGSTFTVNLIARGIGQAMDGGVTVTMPVA